MNILAWLLCLSILIYLMIQAVAFHRATVCRQEAWLKSTELKTRSLLYSPKAIERDWHLGCRIHLLRHQEKISWQKLPNLKKYDFHLVLKGALWTKKAKSLFSAPCWSWFSQASSYCAHWNSENRIAWWSEEPNYSYVPKKLKANSTSTWSSWDEPTGQ